uniref:RIP metalloprotease n=1 Tax=Meiothermus ruber TaxID=277 RepID=A0A7C3DN94_MEIRU
MSILWFLLIISISIFVHELGHYLAARVQGVGVKNFGVGFGPTLLKFERWGTTWRLNAIPLGGYAEIEGMMPGDTHGYARLSSWGKFLILVAGVVMNLLLAWGVLAALASIQGIPQTRAEVTEVLPDSLAEQAGFRVGDRILSLNGEKLTAYDQVTRFRQSTGEKVFVVLRDGAEVTLRFNWDDTQTRLGIVYRPELVGYTRINFFQGFARAIGETVVAVPRFVQEFAGSIARILSGQQAQGVAGPVGIVNITGQAAEQGLGTLVGLLAAINLSLAVFNLLPIPGLDGGRILVLVANVISGGRIKPETEARLSYGGFIFLILLIVLVTINDIRNLVGG